MISVREFRITGNMGNNNKKGENKFLQGKAIQKINNSGFIETDVAKSLFYADTGKANRIPSS